MSSVRETIMEASEDRLASLIAAVDEIEKNGRVFSDQLRINILRNYTIEGVVPFLKFHSYRVELQPTIVIGDYDNVQQEILNPASHLYQGKTDIVVVTLWLPQLDPSSIQNDWDPKVTREILFSLYDELAKRLSSLIVINTFLPPLYVENAIASSKDQSDRRTKVRELNQEIYGYARAHASQFFVIDLERLLTIVGEDRGLDYRFWYLYKSPLKRDVLNLYAREIITIGKALKGKAKKVLVLDCDNTLWGGVVGEEGVSGIQLDRNDYPGRSFYDFQRTIVNLAQRGVVVALCSKNNEQDVWEVLENHPHCLLKKSHLSAWKINWKSKAENIAALAEDLNLGLESFVFVDDSQIECNLIRQMCPAVTVLEVPEKLYSLPMLLLRDGLFDTLALSKEDTQRAEMYRTEFERKELQGKFQSLDDYLASLSIAATIHKAAAEEIPRVAQLVGKTNQFNLTTRRHSEEDILRFVASRDWAVYSMSAQDRFGDLGLIAVLIAHREGRTGLVDSLLMSCRALGRKLELAFVHECLSELEREWQLNDWQAEYLPTKKNQQVESFWESAGFICTKSSAEGKRYAVAVRDRASVPIPFITVKRN
jgi:FkbH-like protein